MIQIRSIELDGFRGYPTSETIHLNGKSLLVFAPNGYGKSSIADAFEFIISPNGTLERFGERARATNTGRQPLRNSNRAGHERLSVTLRWSDNRQPFEARRDISIGGNTPPANLGLLLQQIRVPIIIRGHDLRKFVEDISPYDRYMETASYLGAARLADLQADLRSLKTQLTQSDNTATNRARIGATLRAA